MNKPITIKMQLITLDKIQVIDMTREDREYLIVTLTELSSNKTESYFNNLTDEELEKEYDRMMEG